MDSEKLSDSEVITFSDNLKIICESDIEKQNLFGFLLDDSTKDLWITNISISKPILKDIEKLRNICSSELKKKIHDFNCFFHYLLDTKDSEKYSYRLHFDLTQISKLMPQGRRLNISFKIRIIIYF